MSDTNPFIKQVPQKWQGRIQTIFGQIPAKSNHMRIVTFRSKDPLKKNYSHLAKTKELNEYEKSFSLQCTIYRNAGIKTKCKVEADVYFKDNRSDIDNVCKGLFDMLQTVNAIENDNLIYQLEMRKHIDKLNPRIEFIITPIE